jgi:hypothetical protein
LCIYSTRLPLKILWVDSNERLLTYRNIKYERPATLKKWNESFLAFSGKIRTLWILPNLCPFEIWFLNLSKSTSMYIYIYIYIVKKNWFFFPSHLSQAWTSSPISIHPHHYPIPLPWSHTFMYFLSFEKSEMLHPSPTNVHSA